MRVIESWGLALRSTRVKGCGFLEPVYQGVPRDRDGAARHSVHSARPHLALAYKDRTLKRRYRPDFVVLRADHRRDQSRIPTLRRNIAPRFTTISEARDFGWDSWSISVITRCSSMNESPSEILFFRVFRVFRGSLASDHSYVRVAPCISWFPRILFRGGLRTWNRF